MPKVKVDEKLLEAVARNARLELSPKEAKKFLREMKEVLKAFSVLDKVKADKAKPSFQPIELKNVWRNDEAKPCLTQEEALANTKHREKGYFKGPRVV